MVPFIIFSFKTFFFLNQSSIFRFIFVGAKSPDWHWYIWKWQKQKEKSKRTNRKRKRKGSGLWTSEWSRGWIGRNQRYSHGGKKLYNASWVCMVNTKFCEGISKFTVSMFLSVFIVYFPYLWLYDYIYFTCFLIFIFKIYEKFTNLFPLNCLFHVCLLLF